MEPLERAARLRREADEVLREIRLLDILSPHSRLEFHGSYLLDVMAYPDIDLYIAADTVGNLFAIAGQLASNPLISEVVFQRSKDPALPGGLYVKLRVEHGGWGRPWKIDIWSLSESIIDQQLAHTNRFLAKMTPFLREQIIRFKCSVLTAEGRTPMYSGYFIYKAFLDEGVSDYEDVRRYLAANGVKPD